MEILNGVMDSSSGPSGKIGTLPTFNAARAQEKSISIFHDGEKNPRIDRICRMPCTYLPQYRLGGGNLDLAIQSGGISTTTLNQRWLRSITGYIFDPSPICCGTSCFFEWLLLQVMFKWSDSLHLVWLVWIGKSVIFITPNRGTPER